MTEQQGQRFQLDHAAGVFVDNGVEMASWEVLARLNEIPALEAENEQLRAALAGIKRVSGEVCDEFEICTHESCRSSYSAWAIADNALTATKPSSAGVDTEGSEV